MRFAVIASCGISVMFLMNIVLASGDIVIAEKDQPPVIVEMGSVKAPSLDVNWLRSYIGAVCGAQPILSASRSESQQCEIILAYTDALPELGLKFPKNLNKPEAYIIRTLDYDGHTSVVLASRTSAGLRQAILHLIRKVRQDRHTLLTAPLNVDEQPWIPSREVTNFTCWPAPQDPRLDVIKYDKQRMDTYIDMFASFGFNGIQILDLSAVYKRLDPDINKGAVKSEALARQMAARIHAHSGSATQWVWGGEIGADDPEYDRAVEKWLAGPRNGFEVDDPDLRSVFDRWYTRYARLYDCIDRVTVHYGEPGGKIPWKSLESQLAMHKFLIDHYPAKKEPIIFGVNLWRSFEGVGVCSDGLLKLIKEQEFPAGHVFYEPGLPDEPPMPLGLWSWADRAKLRKALPASGYKVGIWSDYLEDMESDGLSFMSVNDRIIKEFYNNVREKLEPITPTTCWSAIDASHIVNIYSMYCSARLLWNPDYDTDVLLKEITEGIWGPKNGAKVLSALRVIRDTRSGSTWTNYWFGSGLRHVGTDDPRSDLKRVAQALASLRKMKPDADFVPKFPLPLKPMEFVEFIIPNLEQIAWYAQNRLTVDEILKKSASGASMDELFVLKKKINPIPDLGTWTGVWGPLEGRAMKGLMQKLADTGVALGPMWWEKGTGLTYVKLSMEGPWQAFDGSLATAYSPGGYWADETTLKAPNDLGYVWKDPQHISKVIIDYLNESAEPVSVSDMQILYFDAGAWKPVKVLSSAGGPRPTGTTHWVYEITPVATTRMRVVFTRLKYGGAPSVAEMSFWSGDTKVETPFDIQ